MRRLLPKAQPWHLMLLSLAASGAAAAWAAAEARAEAGDPAAARRLRWAAPALLALSTGVSLLPLRWGWVAALLALLHLVEGLALRRAAWTAEAPPPCEPVRVERRRWRDGDFAQIVWGAACGALAAACVGSGTGVAYSLALDRLVSTWLPSLADRSTILGGLVWILLQFTLCGAIAGGIIGARRPRTGAREMAAGLAGMAAVFFSLHAVATFLIEIPAFQQARLLDDKGPALIVALLALWLFKVAATVLSGLAAAALAGPPEAPRPRPRVAAAVFASILLAPWALGLYAGRLSYDAILAGMLLERAGRPEAARRLYTLGLAQHPDDKASSLLEFRIAMVHHRLKRDDEAKAVLRRLVARSADSGKRGSRQVELAQQYLQAWDRAPQGARRVTLPGIETTTEFKAGYCVPNSLSLALRYWGVADTAKDIGSKITALDWGTSIEDSVWYVEDRGLRHFLAPLSSTDDVKGLIDLGLPALIYIPQHVLAVIGYDESLDTFVTYDVAQEAIWVDHPVSQLLPQWKGEEAIISLVLPEERFLRLPEERRRRLESATLAHLHFLLHLPHHHTEGERHQALALSHLEAAIAADPGKFYSVSHLYARSEWGQSPRRRLLRERPLAGPVREGLAFTRRDFDDSEALGELCLSALDLGLEAELRDFLEARRRDGSLDEHDGLRRLLGGLELKAGQAKEAAATLSQAGGDDNRPWSRHRPKDDARPWLLALAQERSGAATAARETLLAILRGGHSTSDDDDGRHMPQVPGWMAALMGQRPQPMQDAPRDLGLRRAAAERLTALATGRSAEQSDVDAARAFAEDFPWEAQWQARYAELLAQRLASAALSPAQRQAALTHLRRAAALAGSFAPGSAAARAARAAADRFAPAAR